ncbi:NAD-dependent epimerase/dehydratase family protein [Aquabacterium sp.]|uniref:NAD-dependent epimerase/dehydratase family protein n=1 Tax=Aquabacterium sp. TaxID=1872578 RepID=UPI00248A83DB|nr:NAD-dependent epimerase/dehydratase family protein [Aquabacterium sp.]MDI1260214.1 NAD-dependent epimerase/dehydratase family protein [Aquabacterium sp.]
MNRADTEVLVTGGCGFLGRALVGQILAHTKWSVRVLALPHEQAPNHWGLRVGVIRGDITNSQDVDDAVMGCRTVFHLAAMVGDAGRDEDHERVTVGGTAHVFDAARRHCSAVVLTTSICAYGDAIQRGVCHEGTWFGKAQGPYGRAKQRQEQLAKRFANQGGRVCVVRPANIVGPGSGPWLLDAAHALRQGMPALVGGGRGNAALAVVDNVADFLLFASTRPVAFGQVFNVHDGLPVTWQRYFEDLARLLNVPPPRSVPRALAYLGAHVSEPVCRWWNHRQRPPVTLESLNLIAWNNQFPTDKARALGWAPQVSYEMVLAQLARDIAQRGL